MYKNIKILLTATLPLLLFMACEKPDEDSFEGNHVYFHLPFDTTLLKYFPKYEKDTLSYADEQGNIIEFIAEEKFRGYDNDYLSSFRGYEFVKDNDSIDLIFDTLYLMNGVYHPTYIDGLQVEEYYIYYKCQELNAKMLYAYHGKMRTHYEYHNPDSLDIFTELVIYEDSLKKIFCELAFTDILKYFEALNASGRLYTDREPIYNLPDTFSHKGKIYYDSIPLNGKYYTHIKKDQFKDFIYKRREDNTSDDWCIYSYDLSLIIAFTYNGKKYVLLDKE